MPRAPRATPRSRPEPCSPRPSPWRCGPAPRPGGAAARERGEPPPAAGRSGGPRLVPAARCAPRGGAAALRLAPAPASAEAHGLYERASRAYADERFGDAAEYARHAAARSGAPLRDELLCLRGEACCTPASPGSPSRRSRSSSRAGRGRTGRRRCTRERSPARRRGTRRALRPGATSSARSTRDALGAPSRADGRPVPAPVTGGRPQYARLNACFAPGPASPAPACTSASRTRRPTGTTSRWRPTHPVMRAFSRARRKSSWGAGSSTTWTHSTGRSGRIVLGGGRRGSVFWSTAHRMPVDRGPGRWPEPSAG